RRGVLGRRGDAQSRGPTGGTRLPGNDRLREAAQAVRQKARASRGKLGLAALAGLLPFLAPYRRHFVLAGIALLAAAAATLALPYAFRQMIDLGFGPGVAASGGAGIDRVFLSLFALASALALATAARFYMVSWLGERVTADIRAAVYEHVLRQ